MTDGASLPIALSDLVDQLRARDLLVGSVTAGNAFGGDLEAVAPAGAFGLAAHVLDADAIVVSMGPGVVGTGTAMGTTALEAAALLDTAARRGGRPLLCIRVSQADERPRHRSISHHVESTLALTHCVPIVADVPDAVGELDGVQVMSVPDTPSPAELLEEFAMRVTSMGRGPAEDPVFFRAAVSAGAVAGQMLRGSTRS